MLVTKTSKNETKQSLDNQSVQSQPSVRRSQLSSNQAISHSSHSNISINPMTPPQAQQNLINQSNPNENPGQQYPSIPHISQPSITASQHTQQSNDIEQKTPIEQKGHDSQLTTLSTSSDIVSEHDDDDERFLCPISLEQMSDPVCLPSGHTIDRSSANNILKTTRLNPFTQKEIKEEDIVPNYSLREELDRYKEDKEKIERAAQKNKELNEYIDSIDKAILIKTIHESKDEAALEEKQQDPFSYRPPSTNPNAIEEKKSSFIDHTITPSAPPLTRHNQSNTVTVQPNSSTWPITPYPKIESTQNNKELNECIDSIDKTILIKSIYESKDEAALEQKQPATSSYRPPGTNPNAIEEKKSSFIDHTITPSAPPLTQLNQSNTVPVQPNPSTRSIFSESTQNNTNTVSSQNEHSQTSDSSNTSSVIPINGFHTIHFKNGDRYTGQIEDSVMHGNGTYFFDNGDRFEGQFENGKKRHRNLYI